VSAAAWEAAVYTADDGAEVVYRMRRGRDPLVLLHALGCDASMWDGVVASLPPDRALIVPEMRGHGGSTLGWRAPSVDQWAADVVEILRRNEIVAPAIAGLSMGGYVGLAIAAARPGLARAYGFVDTTAAPDDEGGRARRAAGCAMIRRSGWRAFADALIPSLLNDNRPRFAEHRDHLVAMLGRSGDSGLPPTLMALAGRADRRSLLPSLRVPAAVVVGSVDALTPPDASRALAAGIPGSKLHILDNVAHLSALEAPAELAALLTPL
jgi:pimeloyl-ACP methyl ester carboxylesterase